MARRDDPDNQAGRSDDFMVECDGAVVGKAGLWSDNEIGFLLSPSVWGRVYAREALEAVIERGFVESGHAELRVEADPRNERCVALLGRLGFKETGRVERTRCIGGEWSASVYFVLAQADRRYPVECYIAARGRGRVIIGGLSSLARPSSTGM